MSADGARADSWLSLVQLRGTSRLWLLSVELGWYGVILGLVLGGHLAGYTAPHRVEFFALTGLAVVCALAALTRWWQPGWAGPIAVLVITVGIVVLLTLDTGPLGALRQMLSFAITPILLAASVRRADRSLACLTVVLAAVAAGVDVAIPGNTLSVNLSHALLGRAPTRPVVLLAAVVLVVVPVAVGLLLRSSDNHRRAEGAARVRTEERRQVARELHDIVSNHVTGMIVTAQATGLAGDLPPSTGQALENIEAAGNRALEAMQQMVRALRSADVIDLSPDAVVTGASATVPGPSATSATSATSAASAETTDTDPESVVRAAIDGDEQVRLRTDGRPGALRRRDVAITAHRVVTEALTNARRHAPWGSPIDVVLGSPLPGVLVLEIVNQRGAGPSRTHSSGYGLLGLTERVTAVGGTLEAGPVEGRWRVRAELPC